MGGEVINCGMITKNDHSCYLIAACYDCQIDELNPEIIGNQLEKEIKILFCSLIMRMNECDHFNSITDFVW